MSQQGKWLVALGAIAAVLIGVLAWRTWPKVAWRTVDGREYRVIIGEVAGLRAGDRVRYGGLPAGRVRAVRLDPENPAQFIVTVRVADAFPILRDTRATIVDATGVVDRHVRLIPGTRGSPALRPGSVIATADETPSLQLVLTSAVGVLGRLDTLLIAADPLIRGDFFARLDRTTTQLATLTSGLARSAPRWTPALERAANRVDELTLHAEGVLAALDSAGPALRETPEQLLVTLEETRTLLDEVREGLAQGGGVAPLMRNLAATSDQLSRITRRLERDPTSIIRGRATPEKSAGPEIRK